MAESDTFVQAENYRFASVEKERAEIMQRGVLYSLAEKVRLPLWADEVAELFRSVSKEPFGSLSFAYFCRCLAARGKTRLSDWTTEALDDMPPVVSFMRSSDTEELLVKLKEEENLKNYVKQH